MNNTSFQFTALCDFIRDLSKETYFYLSNFFSYQLGMSETGITDIFVFRLVNFVNNFLSVRRVEVYKTTWPKESKYGNDIDLFVKCENGQYAWFALQAKVMSYNGAYKDLKMNKNQWDKLLEHETIFKSKSFYLFYNGKPNIKPYNGIIDKSDCVGVPSIEELGLGIVETNIVKNVVENNPFPTGQIKMSHFLPSHMDSLRKLFCCANRCNNLNKLYEYNEIYKGAPYEKIKFREDFQVQNEELPIETEAIISKETEGIAQLRIIIS